MTLLHELGHHFFPVHKNGGGRFLSEALANFFCQGGLNEKERAWLLYKTWFLQPREYSAYRTLENLLDADHNARAISARWFHGDLSTVATTPKIDKHDLALKLGSAVVMGIALDYCSACGLLEELGNINYMDARRGSLIESIARRLYKRTKHPFFRRTSFGIVIPVFI